MERDKTLLRVIDNDKLNSNDRRICEEHGYLWVYAGADASRRPGSLDALYARSIATGAIHCWFPQEVEVADGHAE